MYRINRQSSSSYDSAQGREVLLIVDVDRSSSTAVTATAISATAVSSAAVVTTAVSSTAVVTAAVSSTAVVTTTVSSTAVVAAGFLARLGAEELVGADEPFFLLLGTNRSLLGPNLLANAFFALDALTFHLLHVADGLGCSSESSKARAVGGEDLGLVFCHGQASLDGFRCDLWGGICITSGGGCAFGANFSFASGGLLGQSTDSAVPGLFRVTSTTTFALTVAGLAGASTVTLATVRTVTVVTAAVVSAVGLGVVVTTGSTAFTSASTTVTTASTTVVVVACPTVTAVAAVVVPLLLGASGRSGSSSRLLLLLGHLLLRCVILVIRVRQRLKTVEVGHDESQSQNYKR